MTAKLSGAAASLLLLLLLAGAAASRAGAADKLQRFAADPAQVSVSGVSAGAFMANQLHIAHAAGIIGAGLVAGGLFGCAVDQPTSNGVQALDSIAVGPCMAVPTLLQPVAFYAGLVRRLAARGLLDPPENLAASRLYVFTGQADNVVAPPVVAQAVQLYRALGVPAAHITFHDRDLPAGHAWITKDTGNACAANAAPFINHCDYDLAGDMLAAFYGPLQPPARPPAGRIVAFDQTEFTARPAAAVGLSDTGYLFVPRTCEPGAMPLCRLHVALHGCLQSAERRGDEFYTSVGLNDWADSNRIIVLYPQAHATDVSQLVSQTLLSVLNTNLEGCWNWWGYADDALYLTQRGVQLSAIWAMVRRVSGSE
jgi:poly(3-hydroxybutyrate) depolymerase